MDNSSVINDIRPLKEPVEIAGDFPLAGFLIFILALIVTVMIFIYFKKRKQTAVTTAKEPLKSPEEIAIEELNALREKKLEEKGLIKEHYIEISDIIRKYIEGKFRVFALDRTTWEVYQEIRGRKIPRQSVDKIKDFLEDCDMVKFAKYIPGRREIEENFKMAEDVVGIAKSGQEL